MDELEIINSINTNSEMMNGLPLPSDTMMGIFGGLLILINILAIVGFLLKAWGLWKINKKLGEPYPWLAWIPVIQIYSFVKAAGKNGIWVLWLILGFIAFIIPGIIIYIILCSNISKRTGRGLWSTLGVIFIPSIMIPIIGYKLEDKSNQTNEEENNISEQEKIIEEKTEL